jgi:hypothetical protein
MVGGGGKRLLSFAAREADIVAVNPVKISNEEWADQNVNDATAAAADRKLEWIRDAAGARFDDLELSIVAPFVVITDDRQGFAETILGGLDTGGVESTPADVLASPYVAIGTIDEICQTLEERRERWKLSYYVFNDDSVDAVAPIVERLSGH